MSEDFSSRAEDFTSGDAIDPPASNPEQEHPPEEKALQEVKEEPILHEEEMLSELKNRNNPIRLAVVQDKSNQYSKAFRDKFAESMNTGETINRAISSAERCADTVTTFTDEGNPCRPRPKDAISMNKTIPGNIIGITAIGFPEKSLTEEQYKLIKAELNKALSNLDGYDMPHIMDCTWEPQQGYMRVVCGNRSSVQWLEAIIPTLKLWPDAEIEMRSEPQLDLIAEGILSEPQAEFVPVSKPIPKPGLLPTPEAGLLPTPKVEIASVSTPTPKSEPGGSQSKPPKVVIIPGEYVACIPNSSSLSIQEILNCIQSQNNGLNTSSWNVRSNQVCDDRRSRKVEFSIPLESEQEALKLLKNILNFKSTTFRMSVNVVVNHSYRIMFPAELIDPRDDVLEIFGTQNEGLLTQDWTIASEQVMKQYGQRMAHYRLIVDSFNNSSIKRAQKQLNFKHHSISFRAGELETAERKLAKARGEIYVPKDGEDKPKKKKKYYGHWKNQRGKNKRFKKC